MFMHRGAVSARTTLSVALVAGVLVLASCAEEPTSISGGAASTATGAGGASVTGGGAGTGGDLGDAYVLFFAAEEEDVTVESDGPSNPSSVARGDARLFTLPVERDCPGGASTCVAFTRSGESSPTRLEAGTDGLLVHVFAGASGLDDDVTIDASEIPSPGEEGVSLHYRSLVGFIEYGVLDEGSAFVPFRAGFNQVDPDEPIASFDSDSGIVRVELPEPLEAGGRYAMVVGEEPGGHFVTYCLLDGAEEQCSSFSSDLGS